MSPHSKDQVTRLLAILGSLVVIVGVNVPCVWIGSLYINPSATRQEVLTLSAVERIPAIAILALTGVVCGATFVKSLRALWIWLGALLLAAAIALTWWRLNASLNVSLRWLQAQYPGSPGFRMLWGWIVLAAGGALQVGTAIWASFRALRHEGLARGSRRRAGSTAGFLTGIIRGQTPARSVSEGLPSRHPRLRFGLVCRMGSRA